MQHSGISCRGNAELRLRVRHCERSDVSAEALAKAEAIHSATGCDMDCFVAEPVIGPRVRADPLAPRNDDAVGCLTFE
jgi:hypothetical protein